VATAQFTTLAAKVVGGGGARLNASIYQGLTDIAAHHHPHPIINNVRTEERLGQHQFLCRQEGEQ
jgi:hypothetical protein